MRTLVNQTMVEVALKGGGTWKGTEAQLRRDHPTWVKYAKVVQPARTTNEEDVEQDYADDPRPGRLPNTSRRYDVLAQGKGTQVDFRPETLPSPIRRAHAIPQGDTEEISQTKPKRRGIGFRAHPLIWLGIGMVAMLTLWVGLQALVSWWNVTQDDIHYGRPRTFQLDAVFGHSDSAANPTHIIIVNLNKHIIIIELPGGDPSHSRIYSGPTLFGDGQDLTPVTGKAVDLNGDGKLDLVLYVQDQRIVFINDNGQFRPLKPGEQVTIPQ